MTTLKLNREERRKFFAQCHTIRGHKIPVTVAKHWERLEPIDSPLTDKKQCYSIACGWPMDEKGKRTQEWREITCLACMKLAIGENP